MKKPSAILLAALLSLSAIIPATAPAAAAETTMSTFADVNDDSPQIKYVGTWRNQATDTRYTSGTAKATNYSPTAAASFTFTGTGIRLVARTNSWSGKARITIDGGTPVVKDLYTLKTLWQQPVFEKKGLPYQQHTIKVEWLNQKNAASTGAGIEIDSFQTLDDTPPLAVENIKVVSAAKGSIITWNASTDTDFKEYIVQRTDYGTNNYTTLTPPGYTKASYESYSVKNGGKYMYRIMTRDTSNNTAAKYYTNTYSPVEQPVKRLTDCPTPTVTVKNNTELTVALKNVKAGDSIKMLDGVYNKITYDGSLLTGVKPSAAAPAWLCGSSETIVDAGLPTASGNGITVKNASHFNVAGINFTGGNRGMLVSYSDHITLTDNTVKKVGGEAIHLMNQTSDSTVVGNTVEDTGLNVGGYGEGVYIGTSDPNWVKFNEGKPDTSDRNRVIGNTFNRVSAECVDAKPATKDGIIRGNMCDVSTIGDRNTPETAEAVNWVALRGNGWVMEDNTFRSLSGTVNPKTLNGVQIFAHSQSYGGYGNIVRNNRAGSFTSTQEFAMKGANPATQNFATCDNIFQSAPKGVFQYPCHL